MKLLWRLGKAARKYKGLYIIAILSTFVLTLINLAAPKLLSSMTGVVESGGNGAARTIGLLTALLIVLYLMRILFRYLRKYQQ